MRKRVQGVSEEIPRRLLFQPSMRRVNTDKNEAVYFRTSDGEEGASPSGGPEGGAKYQRSRADL